MGDAGQDGLKGDIGFPGPQVDVTSLNCTCKLLSRIMSLVYPSLLGLNIYLRAKLAFKGIHITYITRISDSRQKRSE